MKSLDKKKTEYEPCTCPKGGIDGNGRVCDKCGGSEWIKIKKTEPNIHITQIVKDKVSITEPKKLEWEKQMAIDIKQVDYEEMYDYVFNLSQSLIQSTKEETIREVMKDLDKMKWKKTRKTMLLSYKNGSFGFHTGKGEHNGFTVGTLEEYGNSHYNQAIDEIKEQLKSLLKE